MSSSKVAIKHCACVDQQEVSLQGPDTQRHFQLIRDDFLRMNANGEILSLADIKDVM